MKPTKEGIRVQILGKEIAVACAPEEKQNLLDAARYLDDNLRDVQKSGKIIGTERLTMMVALNMASELLELKSQQVTESSVNDKLAELQAKIDTVINETL